MQQYKELVKRIRDAGAGKDDRTGTGTTSVIGHTMRFDLNKGFPLNTLKFTPFKPIVRELIWFLRGCTSNRVLNDMGCTIWDEWQGDNGDLGPIYSAMWRRWPVAGIEMIKMDSRPITEMDVRRMGHNERPYHADEVNGDLEEDWVSSENDINADPEAFALWLTLYRNTAFEGVCHRWTSFRTFMLDLASLGGYELWRKSPHKYTLSCMYCNSKVHSPSTSVFTTNKYNNSLKENNDVYVYVVEDVVSDSRRIFGTMDDIVEFYDLDIQTIQEHILKTESVDQTTSDGSRFKIRRNVRTFGSDSIIRRKLYIDQISEAIKTLRESPASRRVIVSGWNPEYNPETSFSFPHNIREGKQALPPCHTMFQFFTEPMSDEERIDWWIENNEGVLPTELTGDMEKDILAISHLPKYKLSCQLYQRSGDIPLGVPFNIASYSLLTMAMAKQLNMGYGEFIHILGDAHIYNNQHDVYEVLERDEYKLPTIKFNSSFTNVLDLTEDDIELVDYKYHPAIKLPVAT